MSAGKGDGKNWGDEVPLMRGAFLPTDEVTKRTNELLEGLLAAQNAWVASVPATEYNRMVDNCAAAAASRVMSQWNEDQLGNMRDEHHQREGLSEWITGIANAFTLTVRPSEASGEAVLGATQPKANA